MTVLTSEDVDRICLEIMRKIPASTRYWKNSSGLVWTAPNRRDACFIEGALAFTGDLTVLRDTLTIRVDDEDVDELNGCVCHITPTQIVFEDVLDQEDLEYIVVDNISRSKGVSEVLNVINTNSQIADLIEGKVRPRISRRTQCHHRGDPKKCEVDPNITTLLISLSMRTDGNIPWR